MYCLYIWSSREGREMEIMDSKTILYEGSKELGLNLNDIQISQLLNYKEILIEWNKKINLTAIVKEEDILIKHFLDSLSCVKLSHFKNNIKIIDVGTGAGFPGIPIHIYYPNIKITLLDSLQKRINFLQEVYKSINLENIQFVHGRAEDYGSNGNYREKYDIAVARAVAELRVLSEYCLPFVKVGGYFICQKGPNVEGELEKSEKALSILGGEVVEKIDVKLPFRDIHHNIVVIKKTKQTPTKYPRKAGTPTKKPLV